jgi:hypothetical protein
MTGTQATAREDTDYQPMFRAACWAGLLTFGTKLIASVVVGLQLGARINLALAWGWVPYLRFVTDRTTFSRITSTSTLVMAVVGALGFGLQVMSGGRRQRIAGSWCGVLAIVETLIVEYVLNLLNPPYFDFRWTRWTLLVLLAALAVTAAWMLIERPWRDDTSFDSGFPHTVLAGS